MQLMDKIYENYKMIGASVIGPLHVKLGIPNQDCFDISKFSFGNVAVVSDGLGSKKYSDIGSRLMCESVIDSCVEFANMKEQSISELLRLIHKHWMEKVPSDSYKDYECTCLFALVINSRLIVAQLGDGMIVAKSIDQDCPVSLLDSKVDSFSNLTNCIHGDFDLDDWSVECFDNFDLDYVVLCTDGISDDLLKGSEVYFIKDLVSEYQDMSAQDINEDIKRWLADWPVPKHTDDKTLAGLLINKEEQE
jgi:serine/threonine protein phosphatase PrpC